MINLRTRALQRREWQAQQRLLAQLERVMAAGLAGELARAGREAADLYRHQPGLVPDIRRGHVANLRRILLAGYTATQEAFARRVRAHLPQPAIVGHDGGKGGGLPLEAKRLEPDPALPDRLRGILLANSQRWTAKRVVQISATTQDQIKRVVDQGLEAGGGQDEVAREIEDRTSGVISKDRARVIARTETHTAAQASSLDTAKDAGIGLTKQWVAVVDDRTRDSHIEAGQAKPIALDDSFDVGGASLQYPGDASGPPEEIINCRCALVYNAE